MAENAPQRGMILLERSQPCHMERSALAASEGAGVACGKPARVAFLGRNRVWHPLCEECLMRTEAGRGVKLLVDMIRARVREDVRLGKLSLRAGDN